MRVEALVFAGIETADAGGLAAFFADALGLEATEDGGVHTLRLPNGDAVALVPPGHLTPPSDTILGFLVDDVEAATAELVERGVDADGPLFTGPVYRWQHFRAPDGRFFELLDRRVG